MILKNKIEDLKIKVGNIENVMKWRGGRFREELVKEAREMRKARMRPREYIAALEDRIKLLQRKLDSLKQKQEVTALRRKFSERPSIALLEKKEMLQPSSMEEVEKFFVDLYKKKERISNTPALDDWLSRFQRVTSSCNYEGQIIEAHIREKVNQVLSRTSPWKAPGEDGIPAFLYKTLPAANS